jgi:copper(I)-binding protein
MLNCEAWFRGWSRPSAGAALALTVIYLIGAIVLAARAGAASDYDLGSIHISQPWARATPKGATAGAGYMTITN